MIAMTRHFNYEYFYKLFTHSDVSASVFNCHLKKSKFFDIFAFMLSHVSVDVGEEAKTNSLKY